MSQDPETLVPWRLEGRGARLTVHLTPRSSRDAVEGLSVRADGLGVLKARVRAIAEDGKANAALVQLLAGVLKLPKSAFAVEAGGKSRLKTISISGNPVKIDAQLRALLMPG